MQDQSIDLVPLFTYCFRQYKKYASFVFGAMLTFFVLAIVPQIYFMLRAPEDPTTESQIISFIITLVQIFLSLGFIKIMLLLVQDEYVTAADLFNNFNFFLSYFVASFLYGIAITLGLFLLVIPGIFIAIRFQFYPYFIIEENISSFEALQKSYYLTENLTLELFLLGVVVIALNILGILLFGVGILFTYPLTTMATAVVYKSLVEEADSIPSEPYKP